ncbi:hypothetical protein [Streptomyces sp. NPDC048603]|uniref:hypothetical protein n=1 Tax=Streptomyces sp. NPDC048603 TaxID=3365577 RepID=UPI00371503B3
MLGNVLRPLPVALYRTTALVASVDRLQAVDLTTGRLRETVLPHGTPRNSDSIPDTTAPLVVSNAGAAEAVVPFLIVEGGSGTQVPAGMLEVVGVAAESGRAGWRMTVRLPDWVSSSSSRVEVSAVGAHAGVAVIHVHNRHHSVSYGIDLTTHQLRWTLPDIAIGAVAAGTAVGLAPAGNDTQIIAGWDVGRGTERWRGEPSTRVSVEPAGPSLVRVRGYLGLTRFDDLLVGDSGQIRQSIAAQMRGMSCKHDAAATLVCMDGFSVAALDAASGSQIWDLREGDGRIVPMVTTAWHGRVYGRTAKQGVTLDALTGKDMPTRPEAAPVAVNEYFGLVLVDGRLQAYPTGG